MPRSFRNVTISPYDHSDFEAQSSVVKMAPGTPFLYRIKKSDIHLYDPFNEDKILAICDPKVTPSIIDEINKGHYYTVFKSEEKEARAKEHDLSTSEYTLKLKLCHSDIFVTFKPIDRPAISLLKFDEAA